MIRGLPNHEAARLSKGHHHGFCKSRSSAGVHPTSLQNTTENMFQNIHRRSLLPALGPARRYPRPRNHRKRTLIRFQTCISCTPCAAAAAAALHPPVASKQQQQQQQQQQPAACRTKAARTGGWGRKATASSPESLYLPMVQTCWVCTVTK